MQYKCLSRSEEAINATVGRAEHPLKPYLTRIASQRPQLQITSTQGFEDYIFSKLRGGHIQSTARLEYS